jgi:hypothetical protein
VVDSGGHVTTVIVTFGGSGYTSTPTVSFLGAGTPADTTIGFSNWTHKMALPADLKKATQAGGVTITASLWVWSYGSGAGIDQGVLRALDANGHELAAATIFSGNSGGWNGVSASLALPTNTASLDLAIQWQTHTDGLLERGVAMPMVTNGGYSYGDGDSDGWIWTGSTNNSASRESDLTVTQQVFAQIAEEFEFGDCPICVQIFSDDKPETVAYHLPSQAPVNFQTYMNIINGDEIVNFTTSPWKEFAASALGISIFLNPNSPYSMQFVAPTSGAQPDPYGLIISNITVFGAAGCGDKNGIGVLDCIKYAVGRFLPASRMDFPDDSTVKARQLSYPAATTWQDIVGKLDALLDWEYGYRENGTFYDYSSDRLKAQARSIYCIPYSQAGADLTIQTEEIANGCEVTWTHADGVTPGSTGVITRSSEWVPSGMEKFFSLQAPGGVTTAADARVLLNAYLDEHSTPTITGTLALTLDAVQDANGTWHDVLAMREGEYIRLTEAPPEERDCGDLIISRITYDHDSLQATVEVGVNKKRLDRLLARLDAQVKRL